jgi:hypothetical protein
MYSAIEIQRWQSRYYENDIPVPKKLANLFTPGLTLDESTLLSIVASQNECHLRIFAEERNGVLLFGTYQGLQDCVRYENLTPVPIEWRYATHMTKTTTAEALFNGTIGSLLTDNERKKFEKRRRLGKIPSGTFLCGLGRNLHTLGYCQKTDDGIVASDDLKELVPLKVTSQASNFDKYQMCVGIDLHELYTHYPHMAKSDVCGINALGTVLIFVDVPQNCLIFGNNGPISAGDFWR